MDPSARRTADYNRLPYWIHLARRWSAEGSTACFWQMCSASMTCSRQSDAALRNATQTPANDPLLLIPAMAAVTENLGFGVTSNLSYEPPYTFARRMSTLDHLTEGGSAGTW